MLTVLVSRDSTDAVPGQGVLALRCATTGAGFRPEIPVVAQRQFRMVHLFMLIVQFSDKVFYMPVVVLRVVLRSRQCCAVAVHHGRRLSLLMRSGSLPWSCLLRKP